MRDPRQPIGLKLRFHPDSAKRAEEVAGELIMTPFLEEDPSLPAGGVVLDVSYPNGEVEHGVDYVPYIE
jgi:hypothetical protein